MSTGEYQRLIRPPSGNAETPGYRGITQGISLRVTPAEGGGGYGSALVGEVHPDLSGANAMMRFSESFKTLGNAFSKLSADAEARSGGGRGRSGGGSGGGGAVDQAQLLESIAATRETLLREREIFEGVNDGSIGSLEAMFEEIDPLITAAQQTTNPKVQKFLFSQADKLQAQYADIINASNEKKRRATVQAEASSVLMSMQDNIMGLDTDSAIAALDMGYDAALGSGKTAEQFYAEALSSHSNFALQAAGTEEGDAMVALLDDLREKGALVPQSVEQLDAWNAFRTGYDKAAEQRNLLRDKQEKMLASEEDDRQFNGVFGDTVALPDVDAVQARLSNWETPSGFEDLSDVMGEENAMKLIQSTRQHRDYLMGQNSRAMQQKALDSQFAAEEYILRMMRTGSMPTINELDADSRLLPKDVMNVRNQVARVRKELADDVTGVVNFAMSQIAQNLPAMWTGGVVKTQTGPKLRDEVRKAIEPGIMEAALKAAISAPENEREVRVSEAVKNASSAAINSPHLYNIPGMAPRLDGPEAMADPEIVRQYLPQLEAGLFSGPASAGNPRAAVGAPVPFNTQYYNALPLETKTKFADPIIRRRSAEERAKRIARDELRDREREQWYQQTGRSAIFDIVEGVGREAPIPEPKPEVAPKRRAGMWASVNVKDPRTRQEAEAWYRATGRTDLWDILSQPEEQ